MSPPSDPPPLRLPAVILAGGGGRRMGGVDKALLTLGGRTLLERVIAVLDPTARPIAINANGDPGRFGRFGLPVLPDGIRAAPGAAGEGPLAGIAAALEWAGSLNAAWVLTVPCDAPFLPRDLVQRLADAVRDEAHAAVEIVFARSAGRGHPVVALWRTDQLPALRAAMAGEGLRAVRDWIARRSARGVDFPISAAGPDPFTNVNDPPGLERAEAISARFEG